MNISLRSSQSSYGDHRYLSTATVPDIHDPPAKTLVDGYSNAVHPEDEQLRYNPVRGNLRIRAQGFSAHAYAQDYESC